MLAAVCARGVSETFCFFCATVQLQGPLPVEMSLKMNSPPSESELIRAAQRGDRSAFDELSATYRPRLAGLVRERLGELPRQRVEVDDVLQETFLSSVPFV